MGKDNKPQMITIDDKEYDLESLSPEQRAMIDHCIDLDRKIASTRFQLDQLQVGKDAFFAMLKNSLEKAEQPAAE